MHDIFGQRFVAVREPAWHGLGRVFEEPILPSEAVKLADLDLGAQVVPVLARLPDGALVETGLVAVGRPDGDGGWLTYGVAKEFQVLPLERLLPDLDEVAQKYPLSAAGTLARGSEIFFCFRVGETDIAGEAYEEYLVVRHSYRPGVAQQVMWTPVRVVCRNTLLFGEKQARAVFNLAHDRRVEEKTRAAVAVAAALVQGQVIKKKLEMLTRVRLRREQVLEVFSQVYAPYAPRGVDLSDARDLVDARTLAVLARPQEAAQRYAVRLVETAAAAYDRLCDEFPNIAGTAYAAYQAVVEAADWRRGRNGALESAVIGPRALEKARAWQLLSAMVN